MAVDTEAPEAQDENTRPLTPSGRMMNRSPSFVQRMVIDVGGAGQLLGYLVKTAVKEPRATGAPPATRCTTCCASAGSR